MAILQAFQLYLSIYARRIAPGHGSSKMTVLKAFVATLVLLSSCQLLRAEDAPKEEEEDLGFFMPMVCKQGAPAWHRFVCDKDVS